jgi:hypothetical protein
MYTEAMARRDGHGENSAAFAEWMNALDREVERLTGMDADSIIGDWEYAGNFEAGLDPRLAARDLVEESGFPI